MEIKRSGARKYAGWNSLAAAATTARWDQKSQRLELMIPNVPGDTPGATYNYKVALSLADFAAIVSTAANDGLTNSRDHFETELSASSRNLLRLLNASVVRSDGSSAA